MKLRWQTDAPDKPGWWWRRRHKDSPSLIFLIRWDAEFGSFTMCSPGWEQHIPQGHEWAGPIPEPEEM